MSRVVNDQDRTVIFAAPQSRSSSCPVCNRPSWRIHSRYSRTILDLPSHGRPVVVRISARRFRCDGGCPRKIFAERLPEAAEKHARRSNRLAEVQRHIGLAAGGAAGARLARRLAMPVSGETVLRLVRRGAANRPPVPPPAVVGIDDWAWRGGHRYGTIICDLERRRIIDILPDREAATVAAWLTDRPTIRVIARDRGAAYRQAADEGRPDALQVADRWHLMENASAAFVNAARQSLPLIRGAVGRTEIDRSLLSYAQRRQNDGFLRRDEVTTSISRLVSAGVPIREIVRQTGYSRKVVRDVVRCGRSDVFRTRMSSLARYLDQLNAAWDSGCHNGAELWRRLRAVGFRGTLRVVTEWATRRRRTTGIVGETQKLLSARAIARVMTRATDQRSKQDAAVVEAIERAAPALGVARDLLHRFHGMIRSKTDAGLTSWLQAANSSLLASFAAGIVADLDAVTAAMKEPWSNGQTEAQITKLKFFKRQMYGRASLGLLKARLCAE